MAAFYASALASTGVGVGTKISPWTLAELIAYINASFNPGDIGYLKNDGTYNSVAFTISKAGSTAASCYLIGYTSTEGDGGVATILRSSGAGMFATLTQQYWTFQNIKFDANSLGTGAVNGSANTTYINCTATRAGANNGFTGTGIYINCCANNNTVYGWYQGNLHNCMAYNNGNIGMAAPSVASKCISFNNGSYGISMQAGIVNNCIFYNNAGGGMYLSQKGAMVSNCIISNHTVAGTYGVNFIATGCDYVFNCNFYGNNSDTNIAALLINKYTLNPSFNDVASFDFRRTTTAMDGIGLSDVGVKGFDYKTGIGVAPNAISLYTIPTFAGIVSAVPALEGCITLSWAAGISVTNYDIYVQANTATGLFTAANKLMSISNTFTSKKIKTTPDNLVLDYFTTYYCGVRASGYSGDDGNVVALACQPTNNINTIVNAMANTNRVTTTVASSILVSSTIEPLLVKIYLKDMYNILKDPYANQLAFRVLDFDGARVDEGVFFADYPWTTLLINAGAELNSGALLIRESAGVYYTWAALDPSLVAGNAHIVVDWLDTAGGVLQSQIIPIIIENAVKVDTIATDVSTIKKIETGRWKITSNQFIVYDTNGTTPLYTFDLKDSTGAATEDNPKERIPV
jgi:hypothetical protein